MFSSAHKILHSLLICFITLIMLVGYGCTWKITEQEAHSKENGVSNQTAIIERQQGRMSPRIKTFYHVDLGIYKESGGSRHNDAFAAYSVETAPGKVQVGVILPNHRTYYPEVEFTAEPGHKYWVTWMCVPYPYVAIVDAESSGIVALDSYCPDCEKFIGEDALQSTECLLFLHPPWVKLDDDLHWWETRLETVEWVIEVENQLYRNLCYAAEHGVKAARIRLGDLYALGIYGAPQDSVRANFWYSATPDDWEVGRCEKELIGSQPQKYQLRIGN